MFKQIAVIISMCFALACGGPSVSNPNDPGGYTPPVTVTPFSMNGQILLQNSTMKSPEYTANVALNASESGVSMTMNNGIFTDPSTSSPTTVSGTANGQIVGNVMDFSPIKIASQEFHLDSMDYNTTMEVIPVIKENNLSGFLFIVGEKNIKSGSVSYQNAQDLKDGKTRNGILILSSSKVYLAIYDANDHISIMSGDNSNNVDSTFNITDNSGNHLEATIKHNTQYGYDYIEGTLTMNSIDYSIMWTYYAQ
jgi:hypothetical protein